jgi:hypothetical protein
MRIAEIAMIYKNIFKKNLHITLEIDDKSIITEEFLKIFEKKWEKKEIPLYSLVNTILDTDRWEFTPDLDIRMTDVKYFNQKIGKYVKRVVVFADIVHKVERSPIELLELQQYFNGKDKEDFLNFVADLVAKSHKRRWER